MVELILSCKLKRLQSRYGKNGVSKLEFDNARWVFDKQSSKCILCGMGIKKKSLSLIVNADLYGEGAERTHLCIDCGDKVINSLESIAVS